MVSWLIKLVYMVIGWFICLPLVAYCTYRKLEHFPKMFYTWDNDENGYYGTRSSKFWERYLAAQGKKVSVWNSYIWCAWRNPCWNIRFHKWASISVKREDIVMEHEGNTRSHNYVKGFQWYNTVINGKYKSHFRLIPISPTRSLYLRWGWKVYPAYYITDTKMTKFKERSAYAVSIRIRGY